MSIETATSSAERRGWRSSANGRANRAQTAVVDFPYFVMEFDHRDGATKEFTIANAVSGMVGLARLLAEIDKCDVVCCVCHRLRTARRAGWTEDADLSSGKWNSLNDLANDT